MLAAVASLMAVMELLLTTPFFSKAVQPLPGEASVKPNGAWWRGAIITILLAAATYPFMTQLGHGLLPLPENIFRMKVGAVMVSARRSGTTATFDELNKFFTISQMPVVSGRYWNNVYGRKPGESVQDAEGMQNARYVARNMVFLMKSIALGKEQFGLPEKETTVFTNFIR